MKTKVQVLMITLILVVFVLVMPFIITSLPFDYQTSGNIDIPSELEDFRTHLPIVRIETDGLEIAEEPLVYAAFQVYQNDLDTSSLHATPEVDLMASVRYRGSSSASFDKKQFRLELYDKDDLTKKRNVALLGMKADTDWVLHGPYLDKTLIRNALMYDLAGQIMDWAPDTRFCELILNGSYQGVYLMVENVKVSENRLDLRDFSLLDGDTSYLLERSAPLDDTGLPRYFLESLGTMDQTLHIEYPKQDEITNSQYDFISKDHDRFEKILYGQDFANEELGYASVINVDSFVDYYILNEFAMNKDAGLLSTYLYRDLGGRLNLAVWDFNNSFDNFPLSPTTTEEFVLSYKTWFDRLFMDKAFTDRVVVRYNELRTGALSEKNLLNSIDLMTEHLGEAINRNDAVWSDFYESDYLGNDIWGAKRYIRSHDEAVWLLKETIIQRGNFLDKNIELLYKHPGETGPLERSPEIIEKIASYQAVINHELNWLHSLQLDNGAFAQRDYMDNRATVNPYFNTFVCRALLLAHRDQADIQAAKRYIDWHFAHLNLDTPDYNGFSGSIYDYAIKTEGSVVQSETNKETYDSLDSYAATFLSLLYDYYTTTGDTEYILAHYAEITSVVDLLLVLQEDGLTVTKPDYPIKYLMNNVEVYEGLGHALFLYDQVMAEQLPGEDLIQDATEHLKFLVKARNDMRQAIEDDYWNEPEGHYDVNLNLDHQVVGNFQWTHFYADATGQLFPVIHGVITPHSKRARDLYETFSTHYQWQNMEHLTDGTADFYWTRFAYVAAIMGDNERFDAFLTRYRQSAMPAHASPAYNADAAWIILACKHMIESY